MAGSCVVNGAACSQTGEAREAGGTKSRKHQEEIGTMERHGERRRTRPRCSGPEDDTPGGTDAGSQEARWVCEQATHLGLELEEEEVAQGDVRELPALHASLLAALAACWPEFSAAEVRRLSFQVYCRTTGRLHPPRPLRAVGTHLAAEIAAYLRTPPPLAPQPHYAAAVGVPHLWRSWVDAQQPPGSVHSPRDAFE
jgi:hypothetical protein